MLQYLSMEVEYDTSTSLLRLCIVFPETFLSLHRQPRAPPPWLHMSVRWSKLEDERIRIERAGCKSKTEIEQENHVHRLPMS